MGTWIIVPLSNVMKTGDCEDGNHGGDRADVELAQLVAVNVEMPH